MTPYHKPASPQPANRPLADSAQLSPKAADATDDAFLGGRLQILQPRHGYRAGLDAVLLAAVLNAGQARDGRLLDIGAGVGTVGLCAARRIASLRVTLLEREPELIALATQNVQRNGLQERVTAIAGNVGAPALKLAEAGLQPESFTHVVANPPFNASGCGTPSGTPLKSASHDMVEGQTLDLWVRFLARMARPGGTALMIHRAAALSDLLTCMKGRFGDLHVLPLHPHEGAAAIRVIVRGTKASRAGETLLPGVILHGPDGTVTPAVGAALRSGAALDAGL